LCEVVHTLLERLCLALSKEGLGLQKLEMKLTHFDRQHTHMALSLIKPTADVQKLFKLLKLKLDNFDAGLGIEFIQIKAPKTKPLEPREADGDLSALFDTLLNRVGPDNLFRHTLVQSHIPEQRYKAVGPGLLRCTRNDDPIAVQAMRLLATPESIDVIAMMPDSPPRKIVWRRHFVFDVIKADGPERIEAEWWKDTSTQTRDYYRVENSKGLRLWVFKHTTAKDSAPQWYLHGLLA
jgi:protein ImuB